MAKGTIPIYGGISNVELMTDTYEIGPGLVIQKEFAHVMAPFLMAFKRPESPGKPHPTPWASGGGGIDLDIEAQINLTQHDEVNNPFDPLNFIWWIASMFRLLGNGQLTVPVITDGPISLLREIPERFSVWPVEFLERRLAIDRDNVQTIGLDDLNWVRQNWLRGARLVSTSAEFSLAYQAFDRAQAANSYSLAMIELWGGLEVLFTSSKSGTTRQLSKRISRYIESTDPEKPVEESEVATLYSQRCDPAHGRVLQSAQPVVRTREIASMALKAMIERGSVPDPSSILSPGD